MPKSELPWENLASYQASSQLYRLVNRIAKRNRKRWPATAPKLRDAAGSLSGKLARSSVPYGGTARQLRDRAKAITRARFVERTLRRLEHLNRDEEPDPEIKAALEVVERVITMIETGK